MCPGRLCRGRRHIEIVDDGVRTRCELLRAGDVATRNAGKVVAEDRLTLEQVKPRQRSAAVGNQHSLRTALLDHHVGLDLPGFASCPRRFLRDGYGLWVDLSAINSRSARHHRILICHYIGSLSSAFCSQLPALRTEIATASV